MPACPVGADKVILEALERLGIKYTLVSLLLHIWQGNQRKSLLLEKLKRHVYFNDIYLRGVKN